MGNSSPALAQPRQRPFLWELAPSGRVQNSTWQQLPEITGEVGRVWQLLGPWGRPGAGPPFLLRMSPLLSQVTLHFFFLLHLYITVAP